MLVWSMLVSLFLPLLILLVFNLLAKTSKWVMMSSSIFECGFTSYFFSRFSFSSHYFLIGLIFLFLDLELCVLFPFFNQVSSDPMSILMGWLFAFILLMGLLHEWASGALEWKYWASTFTLHVNSYSAR